GATFDVYLPVTTGPAIKPRVDQEPQRLATGTETVLLVEDDAAVRTLTERILSTAGYRVLACADGNHALALVRADAGVSLLVTDVIMPGVNGQQLADQITALLPGLPVVFVSAYTRGALTHDPDDPTVAFLEKPYTTAAITEKVRAVLDARA